MAREDVNIRVSANIAEAIQMWRAMEQGPRGMALSLEAMSRRGAASTRGLSTELTTLAGRWVSISAGITAAIGLVKAFGSANVEMQQRVGEATKGFDQQLRELYVLTGMQRSSRELLARVHGIAIQRGVTPVQAGAAAGALLGANYTPEQVFEGGGLDATLRVLSANAAAGKNVDVKLLVDALTGALEGTGQGRTSENLLNLGVALQGAWKDSKLALEDFPVMQAKVSNVYGVTGMTAQEQLPYLSLLRDRTSPDVAATNWFAAISRLVASGDQPRQQRRLAELGLAPEDVDFVGEGMEEVQRRLTEGFKSVSEEDAKRIATGLFGSEGGLFYSTLLNDKGLADAAERRRGGGDMASFNAAVGIIEGGQQATDARAAARMSQAFYDQSYVDPEVARTNMLAFMQEQGYGPMAQKWSSMRYTFDTSAWGGGASPEAAIRAQFFNDIHRGRRPEGFIPDSEIILNRSRSSPIDLPAKQTQQSAPAVDVNVKVQLVDQNNLRVPHRAEVHDIGKNSAARRNR